MFPGATHVPIATLPGMAERTLTISSGGKTFNTTGWKIGWMCGPAPLVAAARTAKQFLTYVNGAPFQPAIAAGLDLGDDFYAGIAADLTTKRDHLVAGLDAAGFTTYVPQATYFTTVDIRPVAARRRRHGVLPRRCPSAAASSPSPTRCSTPVPSTAATSSASPAASASTCSTRPPHDWRRCDERRTAHRGDPARHRVERPRRQLRAPRPDDRRRRRRRRRARAVHRDVLDRLRRRRARPRRAGGRPVVDVPRRRRPREHGVWVGGSCPEIPRRRAGRRPAAVQQLRARRPRRHGAPLPQDPPVHLRRRGEVLPRRRPSSSPSTSTGCGSACSSATTCASPTSSGSSPPTPTSTSCPANWPAKRRLHWQALLQARAIENQAYVVGVNRVGDGGGLRLQRRQPHRRPARRAAGHRRADRDDPARRHLRRTAWPRSATTSASSRTAADAFGRSDRPDRLIRRQRRTDGRSDGPLISASGLVKRFGEFTAVDGIDVEVQPRRGVRVPRPERRRQVVDDADDRLHVAGDRRARCGCSASTRRRTASAIRARLGVVPQADQLDNELTVEENLDHLRPLLRHPAGRVQAAGRRAARVRPAHRAGDEQGRAAVGRDEAAGDDRPLADQRARAAAARRADDRASTRRPATCCGTACTGSSSRASRSC